MSLFYYNSLKTRTVFIFQSVFQVFTGIFSSCWYPDQRKLAKVGHQSRCIHSSIWSPGSRNKLELKMLPELARKGENQKYEPKSSENVDGQVKKIEVSEQVQRVGTRQKREMSQGSKTLLKQNQVGKRAGPKPPVFCCAHSPLGKFPCLCPYVLLGRADSTPLEPWDIFSGLEVVLSCLLAQL